MEMHDNPALVSAVQTYLRDYTRMSVSTHDARELLRTLPAALCAERLVVVPARLLAAAEDVATRAALVMVTEGSTDAGLPAAIMELRTAVAEHDAMLAAAESAAAPPHEPVGGGDGHRT